MKAPLKLYVEDASTREFACNKIIKTETVNPILNKTQVFISSNNPLYSTAESNGYPLKGVNLSFNSSWQFLF